jgi:RNA polymerase sigma-70 factor (ECF subfamily)
MEWVFSIHGVRMFPQFEQILPIVTLEGKSESLCLRVAAGEIAATEELYSLIGRTVRAKLIREFGPDCEDVHHNIYIDIVAAIQSGSIRHPGLLLPYICTVVRRRRADLIGSKLRGREMPDEVSQHTCTAARADEIMESAERRAIVRTAVMRLPAPQRDIIQRFYYEDQPREAVIEATGMTENQFRLGKSRSIVKLRQHVEKISVPKLGAFNLKAG